VYQYSQSDSQGRASIVLSSAYVDYYRLRFKFEPRPWSMKSGKVAEDRRYSHGCDERAIERLSSERESIASQRNSELNNIEPA
jgi:hypothetical protein